MWEIHTGEKPICLYSKWEEIQHQGKLESTSDYSYDEKTLGDWLNSLKCYDCQFCGKIEFDESRENTY